MPCPTAARPSRSARSWPTTRRRSTPAETEALIEVILREPEPAYLPHLTALLKAGKSPRALLDAIQVGAATVALETHDELNFSLPQHCYEYVNTQGWFWDTFEHPQRLKLLYLAAAYLNQNAWHQKLTGDLTPPRIETQTIRGLDAEAIASRVEAACVALDSPKALGWIQAALDCRPRHRAAGAGHRDGLLAARQRSAQPGNRPLHAGGFRQEPESAEGPPAAGGRASHGAASQVRRPAGLQPPLRQGAGRRSAGLIFRTA